MCTHFSDKKIETQKDVILNLLESVNLAQIILFQCPYLFPCSRLSLHCLFHKSHIFLLILAILISNRLRIKCDTSPGMMPWSLINYVL